MTWRTELEAAKSQLRGMQSVEALLFWYTPVTETVLVWAVKPKQKETRGWKAKQNLEEL